MKKADPTTLGDFLKLGEAALSALLGAAQNLGEQAEHKRESLVRKLDLVTRDEFDAAFAMLKKIRMVQEEQNERLAKLEKKSNLSRATRQTSKKQIRKK